MAGIRIRHVKLPVTDLPRSVAWYRDLLALELAAEFCEAGELRGAQLMHPSGWGVALRERAHCASTPDLTGFDAFAFELDSVDELRALAARAEQLGYDHTEVVDRGDYGAFLDIIDPDGTVVRFLANNPLHAGRFVGVDSGSDGDFALYDTPRLEK
ncbi:VOC family protein [Nocardia huaxiensis]|uniref:VOC family protein n=1 Tax=Nocardia huaxiensis TaxID=2755382 RepID=A0A7D6ZFW0_9NOCA|nr:VOC family protein [Nocardia huaxiensis]QLY32678.1 VOC family protein [Nocardia huaxiensis]UFS93587.1 VOC family protein [Nocardia huaxiensis]